MEVPIDEGGLPPGIEGTDKDLAADMVGEDQPVGKAADWEVEDALVKAGGCGKFIIFVTITMIIAMTAGGLLVDGLPLIELPPTYVCSNSTDFYTTEYKCVPFNPSNAVTNYPTWCPTDPVTGDAVPGN